MWRCNVTLAAALLSAGSFTISTAQTAPAEASVRKDPRVPYFERKSYLKVGAKGEERIDVSTDTACGAFHHAELVWVERRFADAQFVQIPQKHCTRCEPLIVRWYHEPTGRLHFQVHVFRTPCG